jgi:hypothetical protein
MANYSGSNQFYQPEPKYGDVKKMKELSREAPMSGAPVAKPAVNAPQRAQAQATTPKTPAQQKPAKASIQPDYGLELASTWAEIAALPGASDLVKQIAERAAAQYGPR